jgi:nucleotide sugar dehydrogenase
MNVGVIGNGFVGSAVANGFSGAGVKIFDKNANISTHELSDVLSQDFVFICVPTPMKDVMGDDCNLSIIESCFDEIESIGSDSIFIIKSTVPIGTTKRLQSSHPSLKIVHSPEFLTAKFAKEDFLNADRHIIGHTADLATGEKACDLFKLTFPTIPCLLMSSDESESVKYIANCFFATKVSFFNEIYLLIEKLGLNWNSIVDGVIGDRRIGDSHYDVPGHDGDRGFGGTCFPKDINALIKTFEKNGIDPKVLKAAWSVNLDVRKDFDWGRSDSAVNSDDC